MPQQRKRSGRESRGSAAMPRRLVWQPNMRRRGPLPLAPQMLRDRRAECPTNEHSACARNRCATSRAWHGPIAAGPVQGQARSARSAARTASPARAT
eukprot:12616637-Alexandrium_andersonii.AAC.1